ncbi:MAG: hypothetical protein J0M04_00660 [Verrucomicrobia bacterium]|nr:hypothetical protein [Verrucomicrobiota bacterium]
MTNPFKRRWFRVSAWFLIFILALVALLWLSVNWGGARALRATEAKFKAAGESTDLNEVLPDPVPDERNFCAIPILKDIALVVDGDRDKGEPALKRKRLKELAFWKEDMGRVSGKKRPKSLGADRSGALCDMTVWSDFLSGLRPEVSRSENPARTVLECLSVQDATVAELAAGLDRREAQWTPALKTRVAGRGPLLDSVSHLLAVQPISGALALRATAAARCGEVGKAHESIRILIRIGEASAEENLIGMLVACANSQCLAFTVRELCDARAGTVEGFERLEVELSNLDLRGGTLEAWRAEAATMMLAWRQLKRGEMPWTEDTDSAASAKLRLMPDGFFDGSAANFGEVVLDTVILPLRDQGWSAALAATEQYRNQTSHSSALSRMCRDLNLLTWMEDSTLLALRMLGKAAYAQCLIDQAVIACVLEQYRIKNGGYPETLAGVTLSSGKPLPVDLVSGKPMGYQKTPDGKYKLWGVGLDRKDDGGEQIEARVGPTGEGAEGDWVWSFSPDK